MAEFLFAATSGAFSDIKMARKHHSVAFVQQAQTVPQPKSSMLLHKSLLQASSTPAKQQGLCAPD
jgi:hypothetical protein